MIVVPSSPIAIIGAGAWGTALALCLTTTSPSPITLYTRGQEQKLALRQYRVNNRYLPNHPLPESITIESLDHLPQRLMDSQHGFAILCVPMSGLPTLMRSHGAWLVGFRHCLIAAKGLSPEHLDFPQAIVQEGLRPFLSQGQSLSVGLISGPSFAKELAQCLPTAVTLAHPHLPTAQALCHQLHRAHFRLYPSDDPIGVAAAGALKNVLAVASGLSDGLGMGENARAALITRGLHELGLMLTAWGGKRETLYGLSGIGDVMLTCMGDLSRNRQAGLALARGESIVDIRARWGTVEGINTAIAAQRLAATQGIDTPIINAVADIIHGKLTGRQAMSLLMNRPLRNHEVAH